MSPDNRHLGRACAAVEPLESRRLLSAATRITDIIVGPTSSVSFRRAYYFGNATAAPLGSKFIFAASDGQHGEEIWVSDGDSSGAATMMLKDIHTGASGSQTGEYTVGNGVVYFIANDGGGAGNVWQVWKTDGTPTGTVPVFTAVPTADTGDAGPLAFSNGKLYYEELGSNSNSLWVSDGSSAGTFLGDFPSGIQFEGADAGHLFFSTGGQVGFSDGTTGGTSIISSFTSGYSPGFALTNIFNGQCYFTEYFTDDGSGNAGYELFHSNGGAPARIGPLFQSAPSDFTVSGNTLYFAAKVSDSLKDQIYSTDGTTVTKVTAMNTSPDGLRDLTDVNGTLFFTASIGGGVRQMLQLVGGKPTKVPLASDGGGTGPGTLATVGSSVFFNGVDTASKSTLYVTDGTTTELVGGDPGFDPAALINVNGTLFYSADDPNHGTELHTAVPTSNTPLSIDLGPTKKIKEGDTVTFHGTVHGAPGIKKIWWDYEGTGKYVLQPTKGPFTHKYADVPKSDIDARVKILTTDGRTVRGGVIVHVENVDPKMQSLKTAVSVPGLGTVPLKFAAVTSLPITFTATFSDPGLNETYTADWTFSDGSNYTQSLGTSRTATITHGFKFTGAQTASVTITDKNGGHDGDTTGFLVSQLSTVHAKVGLDVLIGQLSGTHKVLLKKLQPGIELFIDGVAQPLVIKKAREIIVLAQPLEDLVIDPALKKITTIIEKK